MPCYDYGDHTSKVVEVESGKQTSRLCAVFSVLEKRGILKDVLNAVDWKEAGVSRDSTDIWWLYHKAKDEKRRLLEKVERQAESKRQEILKKLSKEEQALLGLTKIGYKK